MKCAQTITQFVHTETYGAAPDSSGNISRSANVNTFMSVPYTIDEFRGKATARHGDRYDYTNSEFVDGDKVTIRCRQHGIYVQRRASHILGQGCVQCARSDRRPVKLLTIEEVIEKFRAVHGDLYIYSNAIYLGAIKPIVITCREHGPFTTTPSRHLKGSGCQFCGNIKIGKMKKLTLDEFISRARDTHGSRYQYSGSLWTGDNGKSQAKITCLLHGDFIQSTASHIAGSGCHNCSNDKQREVRGKMPRRDTAQLIADFRIQHGDLYDYSLVTFTQVNDYVSIGCPVHGIFSQKVSMHLKGSGCPKCRSVSRAITTESFLKRAHAKHGSRYDYSMIERMGIDVFGGATQDISIVCRQHGVFRQSMSNHLFGKGCIVCAYISIGEQSSIKIEDFVKRSATAHNGKYDYSKTVMGKYVEIICPVHAKFRQLSSDHMSGKGCFKCGRDEGGLKKRITMCKFITKARLLHGEIYDYKEIKHEKRKSWAIIVCSIHGQFRQVVSSHLQGCGCPKCTHRVSKPSTKWLDGLGVPMREFRIPTTRFIADGYHPDTKTVYEFYGDYWHGNPNLYPSDKMHPVSKKTFGELYQKTLEKEAVIRALGYNLVVMWESEWRAINKS